MCVVLFPTYATSKDVLAEIWCCSDMFHCCRYVLEKWIAPESTSGCEQETSVIPNEHGCPGLGFAETTGWPRKKSAHVRVGTTGGRSLKTVCVAMNGTVATLLLIVLLSGKT